MPADTPSAPAGAADASLPTCHVRPPAGWLNDPNGPIRWGGKYHLFFQYNPASPTHGDICWGHSSSVDLVHWQDEPVALAPTPGGPDGSGCWSGCAVRDDGVATAVYTGVTGTDGQWEPTICVAYAEDDDLRVWSKDPTPVAAPPQDLELLGYRDPFVFMHEGHRYAVVGAGRSPGAAPLLLLYSCDDMHRWIYRGPLLEGSHPVAKAFAAADIWECPQLVRVDGRWVLVLSLWEGQRLGRVAYLVGDLHANGEGVRFEPTSGGQVDDGHDFYAPSVLDDDGRAVLWGWSWEDRVQEEVVEAGWAGILTLPRQLRLTPDDRLVTSPVPEVSLLRGDPLPFDLADGHPALLLPTGPVDLELAVKQVDEAPVELRLVLGCDSLTLALDGRSGRAALHREVHDEVRRGWTTDGTLPAGRTTVQVRIIRDASLVEIHLADGSTYTERLYPRSAVRARLELAGPGCAATGTAWSLA